MAFSLILICARVFITVLKIKSIIYIILPVYTAENLKLLITTYLPDLIYVEVILNHIPKKSSKPN